MNQTTSIKTKLKPPIFICGSGRSGTTLLRKAIGNHPNIYAIEQETYMFVSKKKEPINIICSKFEKKKDMDNLTLSVLSSMFYNTKDVQKFVPRGNYPQNVIELFNEIKNTDGYKFVKNKFEIFNLCASYLTRKNNKNRWVEKNPRNIQHVKEILKIYPDAKIIVITRDPRAVYYSWKKRGENIFNPGLEYRGLVLWLIACSNSQILEKEAKNNLYQIKYENLVLTPEEELKKLCAFLEEPYDPNMLNVSVINTSFADIRKHPGFKTTQIDRWKDGLKDSEKILIDRVTRKFKKYFGYADSKAKLNFFNFFSFICLMLEILIKSSSVRHFIGLYYKYKQKHYYKALKKNVKVMRWIYSRRKLIKEYLSTYSIKKLNISNGHNRLKGWLNASYIYGGKKIIYLNLEKKLPFREGTFDYIACEQVISSCFTSYSINNFLNECYRILKPSGILRIAVLNKELMKDLLEKAGFKDITFYNSILEAKRQTASKEIIESLERSYALTPSKNKLISVVIPCFNPKFSYFKCAIESVLSQNYKNWEVIIVNDGSSKTSFKKIKDYIENLNDQRFSIVTLNKNLGPSSARNKGIEKAKGEIITFLDADDIHFPWYYREVNDYFSNNPECLIFASPSYKYIKTGKKNHIFLGEYEQRLIKEPHNVAFPKFRLHKVFSSKEQESFNLIVKKIGLKLFLNATPRLACKKEAFKYISYDPSLRTAEDSDLCLQILNNEDLINKTTITLNPYYLHRMYASKERLTQKPQVVFENMIKLKVKYNDRNSIASKSLWFLERKDEWKFNVFLFHYLKGEKTFLQTIQDVLRVSKGKILNVIKILKLIVKYQLLEEIVGVDPRLASIPKSGHINKTNDIQVQFKEHLKSTELNGSNHFAGSLFENIFNSK